jgi:hypothetical protein
MTGKTQLICVVSHIETIIGAWLQTIQMIALGVGLRVLAWA